MRDISRIFQGVCNAYQKKTIEAVHLVRYWIHENNRVFADRLIDNTDRDWLNDLLISECKKTYGLSKKDIYNSERLIYGDYMGGIDVENRIYEQIEDLKGFVSKIEEYLEEYNN